MAHSPAAGPWLLCFTGAVLTPGKLRELKSGADEAHSISEVYSCAAPGVEGAHAGASTLR